MAMNVQLSESGNRVVASAITTLSTLFLLGVMLGAVWVLGQFLLFFSGVFLPIAVAVIVAMVIQPYYDWAYKCVGQRRVPAVLLVYLSVLLPVGACGWFFGGLMWEQLVGLAGHVADLFARGWHLLLNHWPEWMNQGDASAMGEQVRLIVTERADGLYPLLAYVFHASLRAGAGLFHFVAGVVGWAIFPIYLGYFLSAPKPRRSSIEGCLPFFTPQTREDVIFLGREFIQILVTFFRGQLLVALLQGLLYAVGFSIVGLKYGFVLGLLLGFLNVIPYLGSMVGLGIAIPLALFQTGGGFGVAAAVVTVFTVVQLLESYVLTPRIMGERTGLHPLAIIVAIFFWGTAFGGIWGMILAIPLTAFAVVCWRWAKRRYIRAVI